MDNNAIEKRKIEILRTIIAMAEEKDEEKAKLYWYKYQYQLMALFQQYKAAKGALKVRLKSVLDFVIAQNCAATNP